MSDEIERGLAQVGLEVRPRGFGIEGGGIVPTEFRRTQARFFDEHPPVYPWPEMLRREGLRRVCKPREALWKGSLEDLRILPGERLLDIGCGTGMWLDRLVKAYAVEGWGIDISSQSLRTAKSHSTGENGYASAECARLPFPPESFDVVICLDVLEHVVDQSRAVREMGRVLKKGGRLLLWTINSNQRMTWNWWLSKLGIDIFDRVAHVPSLLPSVQDVEAEVRAAGLSVADPILFDSFFSLACDEAVMIVASLCGRIGLFKRGTGLGSQLGRIFLTATDFASRWLLKTLMRLDRPWTSRGYSNGFLLAARKCGDGLDPWPAASEPVVPSTRPPGLHIPGAQVFPDADGREAGFSPGMRPGARFSWDENGPWLGF